MLSRDQAVTMLSLQASMNSKVDPQWLQARYPYLRAVAIEGAEAIEHHGWKWWKKQHKDLPQLQMELIDIWHFILSEILLRHEADPDTALAHLMAELESAAHSSSVRFDGKQLELDNLDLVSKLELLIALAVARRIDLALFHAIMSDCEMDWTTLYCQYVGKNVLNMFRQDHGYKQGTYQKMWSGREDNEHLVDIIRELNPDDSSFMDHLYQALKTAYPD